MNNLSILNDNELEIETKKILKEDMIIDKDFILCFKLDLRHRLVRTEWLDRGKFNTFLSIRSQTIKEALE